MNSPKQDISWSEQFRIAAKDWVDKECAASMLEETKSAVLSQKMMELGQIPVSHAEMIIKASNDWIEFVQSMVEARKVANLSKVKVEYIRMKFSEWQSAEATKRAEMRL